MSEWAWVAIGYLITFISLAAYVCSVLRRSHTVRRRERTLR